MSIRVKLILVILVITVPISILLLIGVTTTTRNLQKNQLIALESTADIQKARLEEYLVLNRERITSVTTNVELREDVSQFINSGNEQDRESIRRIINEYKNGVADFIEIQIVDTEGTVIVSSLGVGEDELTTDTDCFEAGLKETMTKMHISEEVFEMHLAGPIMFEDKLVGAVLIMAEPTTVLDIRMDYTGLGESGEVVLARSGPDQSIEFFTPFRETNGEGPRPVIKSDGPRVPMVRALEGEELSILDSKDHRGIDVVAITRFVDGFDWGLVVKIDSSEAFSILTDIQSVAVTVGIIFAAYWLFFLNFMNIYIVRPLRELKISADKIAKGDFNVKINEHFLSDGDEIGSLAKAFSIMLVELQKLYQNLEQKVKARTESLRDVQKDLEEKVQELEKTNQVLVGRELRMVELKEQIKKREDQKQESDTNNNNEQA